jgi:hypothetical protein
MATTRLQCKNNIEIQARNEFFESLFKPHMNPQDIACNQTLIAKLQRPALQIQISQTKSNLLRSKAFDRDWWKGASHLVRSSKLSLNPKRQTKSNGVLNSSHKSVTRDSSSYRNRKATAPWIQRLSNLSKQSNWTLWVGELQRISELPSWMQISLLIRNEVPFQIWCKILSWIND